MTERIYEEHGWYLQVDANGFIQFYVLCKIELDFVFNICFALQFNQIIAKCSCYVFMNGIFDIA